jgi:small subunit ribosomal protein S1
VNWHHAQALYAQDEVVRLLVLGTNRGGLLVNGNNLHGFVPVSHLVDIPADILSAEREKLLGTYVGQVLPLKIIECDPERGRLIFSQRAALAGDGQRNLLLDQLQDGVRVRGVVTNITNFGAFVDLGGVEGLVHISELSWGRVQHPDEVIHVGDEVETVVLSLDRDNCRVALSLKRLFPNPWETAAERYFPGLVVEAIITSVVPFGAFARVEEGLDGLIHASGMQLEPAEGKPADHLSEGQQVKVRVLHVDAKRQRLGLSLCDEIEV